MNTHNRTRGFTLLEIALALMVLAVLTAALTPSITGSLRHRQVEAEQRILSELAHDITRSFESDDFDVNLSAMPGAIGPNDHWTAFSTTTGSSSYTGASYHWASKLSRFNGRPPRDIATNASRNGRHLFVAPTETGRQRFLLFSLVAAPGELLLPEYTASPDWVDQIWNHDWEKAGSLPALWGMLAPADLARWMQGRAGTNQIYRFCVRRITLPKYTVTVNNTHPTDSVFISFNHQDNAFVVPPGAGSQISREIFAGRVITVRQGITVPDTVVLRFPLTRNATLTLQAPGPSSDGTVILH